MGQVDELAGVLDVEEALLRCARPGETLGTRGQALGVAGLRIDQEQVPGLLGVTHQRGRPVSSRGGQDLPDGADVEQEDGVAAREDEDGERQKSLTDPPLSLDSGHVILRHGFEANSSSCLRRLQQAQPGPAYVSAAFVSTYGRPPPFHLGHFCLR